MWEIFKNILYIALIYLIINFLFGLNKYEGRTAEQWFYMYDVADARIARLNSDKEDLILCIQSVNTTYFGYLEVANNDQINDCINQYQ